MLLALNVEHQVATSVLDSNALAALLAGACHVGIRGERGRDGFLIAFDEGADYASPNFRWFQQRYPRFVYVDRVIVAKASQGRGIARSLYEELFGLARRSGAPLVAAEINIAPPNPASDAFHAALGFSEVGRSVPGDGQKFVRYMIREIAA